MADTTYCLAADRIATMQGDDYGLLEDATIVVENGQIAWIGPQSERPESLPVRHVPLITPGLIDCHTHLVFGGDRAQEFEMRLNGAGYEEIAQAGGGIVSTMRATRGASFESLTASSLKRLDCLLAEGVTTVEIKSGYGLDIDTELRMLRVARSLEQERAVTVQTSFLGAHAVPPEARDADDYIDGTVLPALSKAHGEHLVDAVDGFCESIAFDTDQMSRVFDLARHLGLPVKLHAEQLSHIGGTALACDYGALSADHVEYASVADAARMAETGTVATLLPGAFFTLHETQKPPVQAFRDAGVPMALATDANPGSSPVFSILTIMNMGCILFGLTPAEALAGVTRNAARALGLHDRGIIAAGLRADLGLWDVAHPAELAYRIGFNPLIDRVFGGQFFGGQPNAA